MLNVYLIKQYKGETLYGDKTYVEMIVVAEDINQALDMHPMAYLDDPTNPESHLTASRQYNKTAMQNNASLSPAGKLLLAGNDQYGWPLLSNRHMLTITHMGDDIRTVPAIVQMDNMITAMDEWMRTRTQHDSSAVDIKLLMASHVAQTWSAPTLTPPWPNRQDFIITELPKNNHPIYFRIHSMIKEGRVKVDENILQSDIDAFITQGDERIRELQTKINNQHMHKLHIPSNKDD